jgi:hypothetical protein
MSINDVQVKTYKRTTPLSEGKNISYNDEKPGEEGQLARVVTMKNNFVTRSGIKVSAPKKFIHD